jgi:hypothetical protein
MIPSAYCRGCGRLLAADRSREALCAACDAGRRRVRSLFPTRAEVALLAALDLESTLRLRRFRRQVRAGHRRG